MAVRTVGSGGNHAFTQAGLMAAISACASSGDTVRFIQSGAISSILQSYPAGPATAYNVADKSIIFDSDPALYTNDPTTLPKLLFGGGTAVKCFDNIGTNCQFNGLQFEGFSRSGSSFDSGVLQGRSHNFHGDNLYFIDCLADCIQFCTGGTFTRIRGLRTGALFRQSDGITCKVFWVRVADGFQFGVNLGGFGSTSSFYLGQVYMAGVSSTDCAISAGATCPVVGVSVKRALGGNGTAFNGIVSYCTQTGFNTLLSGTDGGNNFSRDPQFTDGPAGDFRWLQASSEYNSGVAVAGVTQDIIGQALPVGVGWPRGAYDFLLVANVSSVTVLGPGSLRANLSTPIEVTSALQLPASWVLSQNAPAAGVVPVVSAAVAHGDPADYVTLTTGEHTDGQSYKATATGILNVTGNANYTGEGVSPEVTSVEVLAPDLLRVRFSEPMHVDSELTSPSSYGFIPPAGLDIPVPVILSVTPEDGGAPTYVDVVIAGGVKNQRYTFRVKA